MAWGGTSTLDRNQWNTELAQTNPDSYNLIQQHPDIGDVLFAMAQNGVTDPTTVQGWLHGTPYFSSTSQSARDWDTLSIADPAEAHKRLDNYVESVGNIATSLGYKFQDNEYMEFINTAARENWDEAKIKREVMKRWAVRELGGTDAGNTFQQMPGEFGDTMTKIMGQAHDYGVPYTAQGIGAMASHLLIGDETEASITQNLRNWAKGMYAGNQPVVDAINQGQTVAQFADPYIQIAAKELEMNPNTINFADPKWNAAINTTNSDGVRAPLSLLDWTRTIRNDKSYGFDNTAGARTQASNLTTSLGKEFGVMG